MNELARYLPPASGYNRHLQRYGAWSDWQSWPCNRPYLHLYNKPDA